ncbi:NALCN channel auxiliary factor 1-like [Conger conger]|uniref:NALCN channel auxiliary factor 1-like n=1 Tax=Conger conger TaxID=82655 RepID=UPI002A5A05C8|nr:NALCN channel auxiliary factor 1-like [Conger conger]
MRIEQTQTVYKPWLCSQHFRLTQVHCSNRIPCQRYCLEVQQRCPFILPDSDDLNQGGSPSFVCTGLWERHAVAVETECCAVRWDFPPDGRAAAAGAAPQRTHPACLHRTSVSSSAACRLCGSRLKLCTLVLVLLHTAVILSAAQNSTGLGLDLGPLSPMEETSPSEE